MGQDVNGTLSFAAAWTAALYKDAVAGVYILIFPAILDALGLGCGLGSDLTTNSNTTPMPYPY